jgi:ABC-type branched-subunit amino acid transport system ATPase component/predicted MFS family arabinose efflux permease
VIRERLQRITGSAPVLPLLILFGLNAVDELDRSVFAVLTPNIRDHFHLENQGILNVLALVAFVALGSQVVFGYFADRGSRVRMAAVGALVWAAFTFGTGLAPTIAVLLVARSVTGIGRAVNDPTHRSLLADYYEPSTRTKVYGFHFAANGIGLIVGPAAGGLLAYYLGWRAPFLIFWVPTVVLALLALRYLKEPVRGLQERLLMGASDDALTAEDEPPSFGEAWRICTQVRTLRRIWYSLPFLASAFFGLASLYSIVYNDVFRLNEFHRGVVAAIAEPFLLLGTIIGIPIAARLSLRDPGLGLKFIAGASVVSAASIVGFAVAPNVGVAIAMNMVSSAMVGVITPAIIAALSLVIPPRVRGLGFSIGSLYVLPGVLILGIIGAAADAIGIRGALLLLVPVYLIGSFLLASAGSFVAADISKVQGSTLAQAEVLAARQRGEVKLLLVKGLDAGYDGVQVLFGVDFEVDEGEIVALLGTNGAGKSTLLKAISGLVDSSGGAVVFDGRDITYAVTHEVAAAGIVQVPGGKGVFPSLTVAENIRIAGWLFQKDQQYLKAATEEVLGFFPVLRSRWDQPAGNLSGGEQQMLTLAQAFIAKPRLLMIDELSLGLAPIIVEQLLEIVRAIRDRGTTIIVVEQSVNVALTIAETAYFMEKGEIRFHGPTAELLARPDVLRSVFLEGAAAAGATATNGATRRVRTIAAQAERVPVLEVRNAGVAFGGIHAVNDVSFDLNEGEIVGIIGPNGAGKTTLFDIISGFVPADTGTITLAGTDLTSLLPELRASRGLGRSFQDARLFPSLTVCETIALGLARKIDVTDPLAAALKLPGAVLSERKVTAHVDELIDLMGLGAFADKFVGELSTGTRRIVDLACVLAHEPTVLLLDEPSSGIAQRETEALGPLLLRIREATGASLLIIEHDMPLVTSVSDQLMALELGELLVKGAPDDVVHDPRVVASYLGTTEAVISRSGEAPKPTTPTKRRRRQPVDARALALSAKEK